jgi:hypothetical protein
MLKSVLIKLMSIPIKQASLMLTAKITLESAKLRKTRSIKTIRAKSKGLTKYKRNNKKLIKIFPPTAIAIYTTNPTETSILSFRNRPYPMTRAKE